MPSAKSAVARSRRCSSSSRLVAARTPHRGRRAWCCGSTAPRAARICDLGREGTGRSGRVGRATNRSHSPMEAASSPLMRRPVYSISSCAAGRRGWKGHRQAKAMVEAEPSEVRREPGFGGRDAEVGGAGDAETAAHRSALDRGHDWCPAVEQPSAARYRLIAPAVADARRRAHRPARSWRRHRSACPQSTARSPGSLRWRRAPRRRRPASG